MGDAKRRKLLEAGQITHRFEVLLNRDGTIQYTETVPPLEWQDPLLEIARSFYGESPDQWDGLFRNYFMEWEAGEEQANWTDEDFDTMPTPQRIRFVLRVVENPVERTRPDFANIAIDIFDGKKVFIDEIAYSLDSETWRVYQ
jgi:hypothetical protein